MTSNFRFVTKHILTHSLLTIKEEVLVFCQCVYPTEVDKCTEGILKMQSKHGWILVSRYVYIFEYDMLLNNKGYDYYTN